MTRFYRSILVIKIFCRAVCYILSQFRIIKFALKLNGPLGGGRECTEFLLGFRGVHQILIGPRPRKHPPRILTGVLGWGCTEF